MSNFVNNYSMQIDRLIETYTKQNESTELEFRIKSVTKDLFMGLLSKFDNWNIANGASFITPAGKSNIVRQIKFISKEQKEESFYVKTKLIDYKCKGRGLDYSISVSTEVPTNTKPTISASAHVRFKTRFSTELSKEWRLDLTAVKEGPFGLIKNDLKKIKEKMYCSSLADIGNFDESVRYEIEIEYVASGKKIDSSDFGVIDKFETLIDPDLANNNEYIGIIEKLSSYLKKKSGTTLKSITNNVLSMNKNSYMDIYPPVGWYIVEKAEGIRTIVYIEDKICYLVTNAVKDILCKDINDKTYVLDTEVIGDLILIFDVCVYEDYNISSKEFSKRKEYLGLAADYLNSILPKPYSARAKTYNWIATSDTLETTIKATYNKKYDYEIDGIIFTEPNKGYNETRNFKWKPNHLNTIDFYVATYTKDLYILCCGISKQLAESFSLPKIDVPGNSRDYFAVKFSPSFNPKAGLLPTDTKTIDGKTISPGTVCEMRYEGKSWIVLRTRHDRNTTIGQFNDHRIAEGIFNTYFDVFELQELWNPALYFKTKDVSYNNVNKFKRIAISSVFSLYMPKGKVLDEASGRGADLGRYYDSGVTELVCIDKDASGLSELVNRKYSFAVEKKRAMNITCYVADLTNFSTLPIVGDAFDAIVCNFAIHYMCDSKKSIINLLSNNYAHLKQGGVFIFVAMDGALVFNLLKKKKGNWIGDDGKYNIKRLYEEDKFLNYGQEISIKLPFSPEAYKEYLVNIDYICDICAGYGMKLVEKVNFGSKNMVSSFRETLSTDDVIHLSLHTAVVLKKT